ncbi:hypothetical protein HYN56_15625 [Flavobacterium crocinum]|uniref:SEFIR domain-containing protein n=1 Tax=Flavobacterium crocinum TaxID=2183896 RepID=A0A2S1YNC2_9FLAO|nr:toll/interleukin-1 receptor domain-containing protein [Flavobacterium crocinum]AWK05587.1 hypothetical protein HYN56_15625 [Flavobacterium crocinum]
MSKREKVFISYSWDGQEHQDWVQTLANDLMSKFGVDVILDQYELSAGKELTHFMETSITEADKVLVILTPNYKLKAENRERGVGFETSIISQEIFASPISQIKFIPILREGNLQISSPIHLKSKLYHDMVNDKEYINKLYELSKIIYGKPLIEKPKLGEIPDFENNINIDPILDLAKELERKESLNNELDRLLDSREGAQIFKSEIGKIYDSIKEKIEFYNENTFFNFTHTGPYRDSIIVNCNGFAARLSIIGNYSNTAKHGEVELEFFKGYLNHNGGYFPGEEPKRFKSYKCKFDFDTEKNIVWKTKQETFTSESLVHEVFSVLAHYQNEDKSKKFR